MHRELYVLLSEEIRGYLGHVEDRVLEDREGVGCLEDFGRVLAEEDVRAEGLEAPREGLDTALGIARGVLEAFVADIVRLVDGLHLYEVRDVARLVEVRRGQDLRETLKGFVQVAVQEAKGDEEVLMAIEDVLGCRVLVDLDFESVTAREDSVIEVIITIVLGTYA